MNSVGLIRNEFPSLAISILGDNYGINIYLGNKVISAYWKSKKYGDSQTKIWGEFENVEHLINIIKTEITNTPNGNKPKTEISIKTDGGVFSCIEHLRKKAELIEVKKGSDNQLALILKITADELYQYL